MISCQHCLQITPMHWTVACPGLASLRKVDFPTQASESQLIALSIFLAPAFDVLAPTPRRYLSTLTRDATLQPQLCLPALISM